MVKMLQFRGKCVINFGVSIFRTSAYIHFKKKKKKKKKKGERDIPPLENNFTWNSFKSKTSPIEGSRQSHTLEIKISTFLIQTRPHVFTCARVYVRVSVRRLKFQPMPRSLPARSQFYHRKRKAAVRVTGQRADRLPSTAEIFMVQ